MQQLLKDLIHAYNQITFGGNVPNHFLKPVRDVITKYAFAADADKWDLLLSREAALFLMKHQLLNEGKVQLWSKQYGNLEDKEGNWTGIYAEDYADILENEECILFALSLHTGRQAEGARK